MVGLALTAAAPASGEDFRFARLNRTYAQFIEDLVPIDLGPIHVDLASPEHELVLREHGARLEPAAEGGHRVELEVVFSGHGLLDADLDVRGVKGHFQDALTLPLQTVALAGRIAIARGPAGWDITLLEGPEQVEVRIQSQMAGRMVPLCKQMALVLVNFDCQALEQALSVVQVPLPGPGTVFFLPLEELSEAEAARLDAYLEGASP